MPEIDPNDLLHVTLASIGDAVIATNCASHITFMNRVAENLTGWNAADALGQPLEEVFRIVNEYTRIRCENPVEKVLRLGQIVGLANHTVLTARDGTEWPIDDSAAPIRDGSGQLRGVVLVFREISERKRAEEAAAERHAFTVLRADLSTAFATHQRLADGLQACCQALVNQLSMAFARIWILDEKSSALNLVASAGLYTHLDGPHCRVPVGQFKIGRIAANRQPHLTNDVCNDPNVSNREWAAREGMVAFAGYPLVVENRVIGVLGMFSRNQLTDSLLEDLSPLTDQIAQSIIRKWAEDRLRVSELRYRLIGQAANDAIWDWDLVTNLVEWNAGITKCFGYAPEQIDPDAQWWLCQIHPDDRQGVEESILRAIDSRQESWQSEYRFLQADNTYATVVDRGHLLRNEHGQALRMIGSMLDMTAKKKLEAERQRFVTLAETSSDFIGMCDLQGIPLYCNPAGIELVGLESLDNVLKTPVADFFFPEDRDFVVQEFIPRIVREGRASTEIRFRHFQTGAAIWMNYLLVALADENGKVNALATVSRNITEQRQTLERIRRSEQSVKLALDAGEMGAWHINLQTRTFETDERFRLLFFGKSEGSFSYEEALTAIHPSDVERVCESIEAAMDPVNPVPYFEEYRVFHSDGSIRWLAAVGKTSFNISDGSLSSASFDGTVVDITDRKTAEETLRYQLHLIESITANATTAIFMLDESRRCTFMNPAAERMTGFSTNEVEGRNLHELIHHHRADGSAYPHEDCPLEIALSENFAVRQHEDLFFRKNGDSFPVLCNARAIFKGDKSVGTVLEINDITEEKLFAHAAFQRSEQLRRLASAATRISVAHDVASVMGVVTEEVRHVIASHHSVACMVQNRNWSQAVTSLSLASDSQVLKALLTPPDALAISEEVCRANRPMRLTQAQLESHPQWPDFARKLNNQQPMRGWLAAPLIGRDGNNLGLIQLTDKCEGEFSPDDEAVLVQLAQMASVAIENAGLVVTLRDADRRKDEFLATLAHELRNPLAPIRTGIELLKFAGSDMATIEEIRTTMAGQTQQLVRLVDDLLDISRITSGKVTLKKEQVELLAVLRSATEATESVIEAASHQLTLSLPAKPVLIDGDPTRLAQIFSNLLTNAARYTENGGTIHISAEVKEANLLLSVRDSGIGIPAEMLTRIFDMFTQVNQSLERSHSGLGIGLTLVKRLVEMHGGTIEARSEGLGQGSEFRVQLPIVVHATHPKKLPTAEVKQLRKFRVLVVDDNRDAAKMLAMIVRLSGHTVEVAHDGLDALSAAEAFRPDVVLMDIGMPRMNGYEAARRLRTEPWGNNVMLIALTGWGQEDDRQRTREAGFDRHLVKPVESAELRSILAELR